MAFRGNGELWINQTRHRRWSTRKLKARDKLTVTFDADTGTIAFFANGDKLGDGKLADKLSSIDVTDIETNPYHLVVSIGYRWRVKLFLQHYTCIYKEKENPTE